ncbi:MAG: DUF4199 domain-containing protein, partial [Sodaliphilus sp.]|nr:DUF4199 domain-containing protein [Sodaliphilus sp.]
FGIYLSAMASAFIFSDKHIALSAFALAMVLATPFIIYRWLKKRYNAEEGRTSFSNLWMMGILIFMCGSLIACGVSWAVMEYLRPNFFYEQAQHIITQYEATPERFADGMQEMVTTLRMVIEKQGAPRSIDLALTGFWFCSFAGSLLSAFLSAIIKIFGKRN